MLELNMMTKKAAAQEHSPAIGRNIVLIYTCTTRRIRIVMYGSRPQLILPRVLCAAATAALSGVRN